MRKTLVLPALLWLALAASAADAAATPISVYGAWYCGNDACTWAAVRDMTEFDAKNRLLVDRGDGTGQSPAPECVNFNNSLQKSTGSYVQNVATKTGLTNAMLGYMFWAAECPSTRRICTTPPNSCEGGVGVGAAAYNVPVPMPPLRQQ
jgi:hypothetical protein